jgi:hypothetical protein
MQSISSWVGTLAAAAIQRGPLCLVYQVRPSCLETSQVKICPKMQVQISHFLIPLTSRDAQGWCMLMHLPWSLISKSSLS